MGFGGLCFVSNNILNMGKKHAWTIQSFFPSFNFRFISVGQMLVWAVERVKWEKGKLGQW